MKRFFYPRLALSNIKKNAKLYIPYLLTSAFTVMMFYDVHSLSVNAGLLEASSTAPMVLELGSWVVVIFSIIFLFYVNSFLIKRRKKEIGLYNILGMEKKHIMKMMFCETIFTTLTALIIGILMGTLLSKFMFLILVKISNIQTTIYFEIPLATILLTAIIYGSIFMIAYLFNVVQIKLANPIELLKGGMSGEKEPKTKWFLTLIGVLTLGGGYYIAQNIQNPMEALEFFFIAVVLVIIGTYCLFTAGSIVILKMLKKNKRFYYQTRHFTSVSQMLYRMKQNAVGLASICILCTCILVMISSTVTLYLGIKDTVAAFLDEDIQVELFTLTDEAISRKELDRLCAKLQVDLKEKNIETTTFLQKTIYSISYSEENEEYKTFVNNTVQYKEFNVMTLDEYNRTFHKNMTLQDNEIMACSNYNHLKNQMIMNGKTFNIKSEIKDDYFLITSSPKVRSVTGLVLKNEKIMKETLVDKDEQKVPVEYLSINCKQPEDIQEAEKIVQYILEQEGEKINFEYNVSSHFGMENDLKEAYGSLFFLGLFLGILFMMAAILIMYYKQLSEGYEDQERFEIMQDVGMSKKEIKQTIRSQVLIFFFLPLIVSIIHMAFASKMIIKMFGYLIITEESLFIICTLISVVILAVIYSIVYVLTAKTYYKIVEH